MRRILGGIQPRAEESGKKTPHMIKSLEDSPLIRRVHEKMCQKGRKVWRNIVSKGNGSSSRLTVCCSSPTCITGNGTERKAHFYAEVLQQRTMRQHKVCGIEDSVVPSREDSCLTQIRQQALSGALASSHCSSTSTTSTTC